MKYLRPLHQIKIIVIGALCSTGMFPAVMGQQSTIRETTEQITTYPFSDPNPVPVLGINKKVAPFYPYFMFDGYTNTSKLQDWKVVKLDNKFITVTVLPEVGGKVMGAVEKSTNNEFVYLNHVMKFRAIGIRGPWTSGGIEHNFGLDLGHAPWAAAPVDYVLRTNDDGSVSCFVGGIDLASRSEWRVEIRLPKDKAYFETNALWFNPTPLHQAYLSWENAAFKASDDLDFYFPGTHHIGHDGLASAWPVDNKGRNLASYKNNNFGDSKSYHVTGDYRNWFGGYWRNKQFGFGHWAPYADAPGKKLWIWSLSREGAIWEDLLTDKDGQYIEAQSGAILNQAAERSGYHSPFTQFSHRPLYSETKKEYWFPVKQTGGIADAGLTGTLNVQTNGDSVKILINANSGINDSLIVDHKSRQVFSIVLKMEPMQVFEKTIVVKDLVIDSLRIHVGNDKLLYAKNENRIERPVVAPADDTVNVSAQRFFRMGEEQNAMRNYLQAYKLYQQCLSLEPNHYEALSRIAEFYYRTGQYSEGIPYAKRALGFDTYHGSANFIYGNLLLKQGKLNEAEEALSVAARTMEYRSAAYTYIAAIQLRRGDFEQAAEYADRGLQYNKNNLLAAQYLATASRKQNNFKKAEETLKALLDLDPLNHYARFEQSLTPPYKGGEGAKGSGVVSLPGFNQAIRNEFPHETYLELALTYINAGLNEEAIILLKQSPAHPMVYYWLAWLLKEKSPTESKSVLEKATAMSPAFVFPFRQESIELLNWVKQQQPSWKVNYYLGLVYWNNLQTQKAKDLFIECKDEPDLAAVYVARAMLFQQQRDSASATVISTSLQRAMKLDPKEWRGWHYYSEFFFDQGKWEEGNRNASKAYSLFKDNPIIAMDYAKSLLNTKRWKECLAVLDKTLVLPQEGAQEGHELYELANLSLAIQKAEEKKYKEAIVYLNDAKKFPENLGSGMPYNPDVRLHDFIAAWCAEKAGKLTEAARYHESILAYSLEAENWSKGPVGNYISLLELKKTGKIGELDQFAGLWKAEQDSVRRWNITQGNAGLMFDWFYLSYRGEKEQAEKLARQLEAGVGVSRFKILRRAVVLSEN